MIQPGSQIGPYAILRVLGQGGMATVYLADDAKHGRKVAIKVMRPEAVAAIGAERFTREIETVARLSHPHILPLYDSGSADGQLFFVMPYVEGDSLRARIDRERQLPIDDALDIARAVAGALGHAHQQGLVHRDVKPENVLLSDGIALVADFGVARAAGRTIESHAETQAGFQALTRQGIVLGTPKYMAPEQAFGDQPVDGRADLYALGCVLYEMLAGQPPFTGPTVQALLLRHAHDPVPPITSLRPGVPESIRHIIEKLLAKSPADRFATAAECIEALAAARSAGTGAIAAPLSSGVTVAVLPFENLSGAAEDELGDGICDELIHMLGRIDGVRVIARGSSFLFRERRADIRTIGAQLNVGLIVDGTVRRSGKRLRLTAQLINVADGFQIWSERYDREVEDVFALEDDIAGAIAEVLRVKLSPGSRAPAASFEAYERYLSGVHHWNRRTPQDLERALEHLRAALQLDPAFAPAWGATGLCYVTLNIYGVRSPDEVIGLAREAVDRALVLDRGQIGALTARAAMRSIYDWDPVSAERDFKDAMAREPSDAVARQWYAINLLAPIGRLDEARAALARARALDPLSPSIMLSSGLVAYIVGDLEGAIAQYERALSLDPAFSTARYFMGPALASLGRFDDAIRELEVAASLMGHSPEVRAALAVVCANAGQRDRAQALLAGLETASAAQYVSPAQLAQVRVALGDLDGAVKDLERAIDTRAVEVMWMEQRPTFAPLRRDPRFARLIARRDAARQLSSATSA
ncbi:MAG TPA: protein kinase [Vicinamibacterales bacterium]|nr:protein kinase [Vicinamibacterales bacterium]